MYPDFKELLSLLNEHKVKYLIVGGYAVSFHAQPRATKDLDILIKADAQNAAAIFAALAKFCALLEGLTPVDFIEQGKFYRMGHPPLMVGILPQIRGVDFDEAWEKRVEVEIAKGLTAFFYRYRQLACIETGGRKAGGFSRRCGFAPCCQRHYRT